MVRNYFIYGEESFLVDQKVNELFEGLNIIHGWDYEAPESWARFVSGLNLQAMFSEQRVFVLDFQVLGRWKELDLGLLAQILAGHANVLVLVCKGKPDKRSSLYKIVSKYSKELFVSPPRDLGAWIVQTASSMGGVINRSAAKELTLRVGSDMQLLYNELAKLVCYEKKIDVATVKLLTANSLQAGIFQLIDAVVSGRTAKAQDLAENMFTGNSSVPYLLQMLVRQYRILFRVRFYKAQGFGAGEINERLKLHSYAFEVAWRQADSISIAASARALNLLAEADYSFKTGAYPGLALLQRTICQLGACK